VWEWRHLPDFDWLARGLQGGLHLKQECASTQRLRSVQKMEHMGAFTQSPDAEILLEGGAANRTA
jgi:hypothetical protein